MAKNTPVVDEDGYEIVPEPDWSIFMFWEDISYVLTLIANFFKSLFGLE